MRTIWLYALLSFLCIGCAAREEVSPIPAMSDDARAGLKRPVNCRNANQDIATIEAEQASVSQQVAAGARTVIPITAVAGLLTGDYGNRIEVDAGEYSNAMELKIDQIKMHCHIQ